MFKNVVLQSPSLFRESSFRVSACATRPPAGGPAHLGAVAGIAPEELGGALDLPVDGLPAVAGNGGGPRSALVEVQEALGGLGYSPEEVRSVLADLAGDDSADLLREALRRLARA